MSFELAQQTAARVHSIQQWITNEFMHSGVRDDGCRWGVFTIRFARHGPCCRYMSLRPCTSLPAHLHAELCMHMACRILEQLLGMVRGTTLIFE